MYKQLINFILWKFVNGNQMVRHPLPNLTDQIIFIVVDTIDCHLTWLWISNQKSTFKDVEVNVYSDRSINTRHVYYIFVFFLGSFQVNVCKCVWCRETYIHSWKVLLEKQIADHPLSSKPIIVRRRICVAWNTSYCNC